MAILKVALAGGSWVHFLCAFVRDKKPTATDSDPETDTKWAKRRKIPYVFGCKLSTVFLKPIFLLFFCLFLLVPHFFQKLSSDTYLQETREQSFFLGGWEPSR